MSAAPAHITLAVGAVVWNDRGQVLLVRRANPPRRHEWSLPGGKVEIGETLRAAIAREVLEETGLVIDILGLVDVAELIGETHYVLVDFSARANSGEPVAGSDAAEARWFALEEIAQLGLWSETRRVIELSAKMLKTRI
ncbi:MAG TPA: NUDIX hydrolase [Rhizomicrobium sp.]|jgi:8-oxo-dGTP diphosphatase